MTDSLVRAVTYNVHGWTGTDGIFDPKRVISVLKEMNCTIVGLQEAGFSLQDGGISAGELSRELNMEAIVGATLSRNGGEYGNVLLTSHNIKRVSKIDLSIGSLESRGALDVDLSANGHNIRVILTHLGLRRYERRRQIDKLLQSLRLETSERSILMGDFNFWRRCPECRYLTKELGQRPSPKTYPSWFPFLCLDRIFVNPPTVAVEVAVHRTAKSVVASDHLPLKAEIRF